MRIVIIGGGFSGVYALKNLSKKYPKAEYFLINDKENFLFTPRLVDNLIEDVEKFTIFPLKDLSKENIKIIIDKVEKVNLEEKIVYTKEKINYDILIFSQGAKTNFFNLKDIENYCMQYKDYDDLKNIKNKIKNSEKNDLKIAVIGGGPTGTELIFGISEFIKSQNKEIELSIYQSGETLVPGLNKKIINETHKKIEKTKIKLNTNSRVIDVKENKIFLKNGEYKIFDIIIWVTGIIPNKIETHPEIILNRNAIPVRETLQINDFENVFAIGDCNFLEDENKIPYPPKAKIAIQQSDHAVSNILKLIKNQKLEKFKYDNKGDFLLLGKNEVITRIYKFFIKGFIGSSIRDFYYKKIFNSLK